MMKTNKKEMMRYIIVARWWNGHDFDIVRKEVDTKRQLLGALKILIDETCPYQISITDTAQRPELEEKPDETSVKAEASRDAMNKPHYPFTWTAGKISHTDGKPNEPNHLFCASCGLKKPLNFERLSGGQKSYICDSCAEKYVISASNLMQTILKRAIVR